MGVVFKCCQNNKQMNDFLKNTLLKYGLSDKEGDIYLTVLMNNSLTVKKLSEKTGINRTTLYPITESLIKRGIIAQFKGKRGVRFIASSPNSLFQKVISLKKDFEEALPQFEAIDKKAKNSPQVYYYHGENGYLSILADTLNSGSKEIFYLGSAQKLNEVVSEKYIEQIYIPARAKKQIYFKQIVLDDIFSRKLKLKDEKELRFTKFLQKDCKISANIVIYGNKVAYFTSEKELMCVLIESNEIAEMEKIKFNMLWEQLIEPII